jgi:basic membrane lipoprotein Med (substrate-binding protein (PBP1-ABC) superfamily)
VITSVAWNMDPTVEYVVNQVKAGSFTAQDLKDFSMFAKGGASLAEYHDTESQIPDDLRQMVEEKEEQIRQGLFRVDIDEAQPEAVN